MGLKDEASKILNLFSLEALLRNTDELDDVNMLALAKAARAIRYRVVDFGEAHPESTKASCFLTSDNILEINLKAVTTIFELVKSDSLAQGMDRTIQFKKALKLFALHETYHIVQGFIEYEKVAAIVETAGKSELGKLDLVADCVAARLLAWIECQRGEEGYIQHLYTNLSISLSLCTLAFPFGPTSKHKVERAVSLFCVRQGLLSETTDPNEFGKARHYRFSTKMTVLTIWVIESEGSDYIADSRVLTLTSGAEIAKVTSDGDLTSLLQKLTLVGIF